MGCSRFFPPPSRRHGTDYDSKPLSSFPGIRLSRGEVLIRQEGSRSTGAASLRLGRGCSGCHKPSPGYDHLEERSFEFIPDHERSSMPTLSLDKDTISLRLWSGDASCFFSTACGV